MSRGLIGVCSSCLLSTHVQVVLELDNVEEKEELEELEEGRVDHTVTEGGEEQLSPSNSPTIREPAPTRSAIKKNSY